MRRKVARAPDVIPSDVRIKFIFCAVHPASGSWIAGIKHRGASQVDETRCLLRGKSHSTGRIVSVMQQTGMRCFDIHRKTLEDVAAGSFDKRLGIGDMTGGSS
mmetsp:Transcript_61355/g.84273  ORF Transcript_61355/g.84273 Transcript_61355/m.84273 type:complete len:103 (-) Transcript_61355:69-377(-)